MKELLKDLIPTVLSKLSLRDIFQVRAVSIAYKMAVDSYFRQPKNLLTTLPLFRAVEHSELLTYYRNLGYSQHTANASAEHIICEAFMTDDIKKINPAILQDAVNKINVHLSEGMRESLRIMISIIRFMKKINENKNNLEAHQFYEAYKELVGSPLKDRRYETFLNLAGANLSSPFDEQLPDLRKAKLFNTNLTQVYLYHVDLREANLSESNLEEADLTFCYLDKVKLIGAKIKNTKFTCGKYWYKPAVLDFFSEEMVFKEGDVIKTINRILDHQQRLISYDPEVDSTEAWETIHHLREAVTNNWTRVFERTLPIEKKKYMLAILEHPFYAHRDFRAVKEKVNKFARFFGVPLLFKSHNQARLTKLIEEEMASTASPQP